MSFKGGFFNSPLCLFRDRFKARNMELIEQLRQIVERLEQEKVDFALCGGLAMAVYAFPRATLDIDILIEPASVERVKAIAHELGFQVDAGLLRFRNDSIQLYRLTKVDAEDPHPLVLDLLLVTPEIEDVWRSRQSVEWEHGRLPVVTPEGLIRLKTLRGSGQDQDDIKHLRKIIGEN